MSKELKEKFAKAGLPIVKAGQEIINFSEVNEVNLKILTCKPDKRNINGKVKDSFEMTVEDLDDNRKIKDFSVIQKRLMELLSDFDNNKGGIINRTFKMMAFGVGKKRHYKIEEIKE